MMNYSSYYEVWYLPKVQENVLTRRSKMLFFFQFILIIYFYIQFQRNILALSALHTAIVLFKIIKLNHSATIL